MRRYLIGDGILTAASGSGYVATAGPGPDFARTNRHLGSVYVSGTFGGATAKIQARAVAGTGSWLDLAGSVTAAGVIPVDCYAGEIRATVAGGGGTTDLDFTYLTENEMSVNA